MPPKDPKKPELPFRPGRDPLAGLEAHPLFRHLPALDEGPQGDDSAKRALRLAYAQLRQEQERAAELQQRLEATEAEKRRLLRQLDHLQDELRQGKGHVRSDAVTNQDLSVYEALFTGELPGAKTTFNNIPLELKAFLTTTKVNLRTEAGANFTEQDQVICALAAYRLLIGALPHQSRVVSSLRPTDNARFSAHFGAYLLGWLARCLQGHKDEV